MERTCDKPTKNFPNGRRGTKQGYAAHRYRKEEACQECKDARNASKREWSRQNKDKISEQNRRQREKNPNRNRDYYRSMSENQREKKREADRKYAAEHRKEARERAKKWRQDNLERAIENSRRWKEANPEKARELVKAWRKENREHISNYRRNSSEYQSYMKDYLAKYYEENKDKFIEYGRRKRALIRSLPADGHTKQDIIDRFGTVCYLCQGEVDPDLPWGRDDSPAVDHVHALSREGCPGDVIENVRLTHALCNVRKHDKPKEDLNLPFESPGSREWRVRDKVIETM